MKKRFVVLIAVCFGALGLAAQDPHGSSSSTYFGAGREEVQVQTPDGKKSALPSQDAAPEHCPVSMYAGHIADGVFVKAGIAHPRGIGQWLSLSFLSLDGKEIAKARLGVDGIRPNGHTMQALSGGTLPFESVQTVAVTFSVGPNRTAVANFWVPGMSAVERIELNSLDYRDGSEWKAAEGQSCRVIPDPKMLIAGR